ncbi:MAG: tRNA uridine-5-carboxymethylaminomethyl(34) synthesis GTPase MnmE [Candidatus Cloacimonetes bacterium]|nr:tRNA uridine-5-carboxymethylaminomethyl(34) synthesis GTPase MnmE [Candidatus Cloacimonadota bacterium]MDD2209795.1 tRNA uridine-5-carboxymethylaminomethyl(34) synthesis GTPase MnmE [Candidatus Cloacimonadota bacterium]MDY0298281.1 tRNA uridine-5-carboxymethylaminomethyl(34) synthesis GTPase MnmE [Candidatus Cloacimonadaceae bacterium]
MNDAICALSTAPGTAAISVIRASGKDTIQIVSSFFSQADKLLSAPSHTITFGTFLNGSQKPIDEVLISVFRSPYSYTGDDLVEISCHGNPLIAEHILSTLLSKMRLANPGEFTLRAYLNGKMDLSRAEAVNDLISAGTIKAKEAALMQVKGYLGRHLEGLLAEISDARLRCELAIDFADQDLPQIDLDDLAQRIEKILSQTNMLLEEGRNARKLREGVKVCLAGAPNAGKSSLFNAFLKQNRAIVTPHPGTTRDYLEESFSLAGFPIVLYDTAGLRSSTDSIECEGIARSYSLMQTCDLILFLYETDSPKLPSELESFLDKIIFVASKADNLPHRYISDKHIPVSVIEEGGLKQISQALLMRLKLPENIINRPLVTNARHISALERCKEALENAHNALKAELGFEFIASDLIRAASALEDILGVVPTDALLGRIFDNFCIGK